MAIAHGKFKNVPRRDSPRLSNSRHGRNNRPIRTRIISTGEILAGTLVCKSGLERLLRSSNVNVMTLLPANSEGRFKRFRRRNREDNRADKTDQSNQTGMIYEQHICDACRVQ